MTELLLLTLPFAPFVVGRFGKHWRATVLAVMVFMVFEGAFRKWLFPGFQAQIYLLKDAALCFALVGFLADRRRSWQHEHQMITFKWLTLAGMVYGFAQLVNPYNPSPLIWAIGFKSYFLYVALLFMAVHVFSSEVDLEKKLRIYLLIMIPVALLGLLQFVSPRDSWINAQVSHEEGVEMIASHFGEDLRARTSGTFSYIGGFATFLPAMFMLSIAMLLGGNGSIWKNRIPLAMLVSCCLAMFTTGARTVLLSIAVIGITTLLLCARARLISGVSAFKSFVAVVLLAVVVSIISGDAVEAFVHRSENSDDPLERLFSPFVEMWGAFLTSPVFGTGLGTSHNSASVIMRAEDLYWLRGNNYELETARVMQEFGIVGFMLVYAPRVALIFIAMRMVKVLHTPLFKALSAGIAAYFIPQLFLFVINNPTGGLYFWFFAGMLYGMYRLDSEAAAAGPATSTIPDLEARVVAKTAPGNGPVVAVASWSRSPR